MSPLLTAAVAESLPGLGDMPARVREAAGRELLYALHLAVRPDPEPDEDDGPWCKAVAS